MKILFLLWCLSSVHAVENVTKVSELADECINGKSLEEMLGPPAQKSENDLVWNTMVVVDVKRTGYPPIGSSGNIVYYRVPCLLPNTTTMVGYIWKLRIETVKDKGAFSP